MLMSPCASMLFIDCIHAGGRKLRPTTFVGILMTRYRFWIHDKDRKGQPLDENILQTAEELAPTLTRYRRDELDCESTSNDMLQSAVEAASKAKRSNHVENPHGYLTSIYKRIVDKFLDRHQKLVPVDDAFLEDLANNGQTGSVEDVLHNKLLMERLINAMDSETRQICTWRLEGYSEAEIAKLLNTTPNAISVRYTRGYKKAAKNALHRTRGSKTK
jgi:RNA polymerase sigma factor (sigma-70 family)